MENYTINKASHIYWIDWIRFIAAFMVCFCHIRSACFVEYGLLPEAQKNIFSFLFYFISRLGREGVLIFFVLSGYLVGGRSIEKYKQGTFNLQNYAIDRFVRIMLPLIGALLLMLVCHIIEGKDIDWVCWLGNLFSLQGIFVSPLGVLWTLSYEVWFYISMGALIALLMRYGNGRALYPFVVVFLCFMVFTKLKAVYLFVWLIGALIYLFPVKKTNYVELAIWGVLSLFTLVVLQLTYGSRSFNFSFLSYFPSRDVQELVFGLIVALFIRQLVTIKPTTSKMLKIEHVGTKLAAFSYTLYLVHRCFERLAIYIGFPKSPSINLASVVSFVIVLLIAIVGSYLMYLCLEMHTSKVKKMIKDRLKERK